MIEWIDIIAWIKTPASPSTDPKSLDKNSALLCISFNKKEKKKTFFQSSV